jgi:hypothetical protein
LLPSGPAVLGHHDGIRDLDAEVIEAARPAFGRDQPAKQINAAWE